MYVGVFLEEGVVNIEVLKFINLKVWFMESIDVLYVLFFLF